MRESLEIVIFGLSVTSSWGNGHATTFRALMRGLDARGHRVTFIERDLPWYADNRDMPRVPYGRVFVYSSVPRMMRRFGKLVANADLVIVGSYVPNGAEIGEWATRAAKGITAFYDIDTPVTLAALDRATCDYISRQLVPRYDLYLSFTGGPTLRRIERRFGARMVRTLYCSADPKIHAPESRKPRWDLGYIGTYSEDRQPWMDELLLCPAKAQSELRMVVAGAQYPKKLAWPSNVDRIEHLSPGRHRRFYGSQRFTLNLTREHMRRVGFSPSVRLFEAAACGTPIISDCWPGLDTFFQTGREILIARSRRDTLEYLSDISERERLALGRNARNRILRGHTAVHRALELESYVAELRGSASESRERSSSSVEEPVPVSVAEQTGY